MDGQVSHDEETGEAAPQTDETCSNHPNSFEAAAHRTARSLVPVVQRNCPAISRPFRKFGSTVRRDAAHGVQGVRDEGPSVCQAAVPELQDSSPQGNRACHLQGCTTQAETRLTEAGISGHRRAPMVEATGTKHHGTNCWSQHPRPETCVGRADAHIRHRAVPRIRDM